MAVSAANSPYILYRELYNIDNHQQQQNYPSNGGGYSFLSLQGAGFSTAPGRREGWGRVSTREVKAAAGAFWQGVSRPSSIEMELIVDNEQLDRILQQSQELSQPFIIDWMAAWCRKCIFLKPKLEKLAAEYDGRVKFYYVDVNKVSQALVKRGNIAKMPTIQLWKDGEMKEEVIGGHKAWLVVEEVREMIQKNI